MGVDIDQALPQYLSEEIFGDKVKMASLTGREATRHLEEVFGDKKKLRVFLRQTGNDAQNWLDKLQQLIDNPKLNVTSQLRSSMFRVMIRLSKLSGLHPKSLLIQNVHKLGKHPIAAGGFGDVWKGMIGQSESDGQLVCLKMSKVYMKSDLDVLFKIYTTLPPFHELVNDAAVILRVLDKKCPTRPVGIPELDDGLWTIMEACWNGNTASRPKASEVLGRIESRARRSDRRRTVHHPRTDLKFEAHRRASISHPSSFFPSPESGWYDFAQGWDEHHERVHSLSSRAGSRIGRPPVHPVTALENSELTHRESNLKWHGDESLDQAFTTGDHDPAAKQDHRSGTVKDISVKTTSSEEEFDLLFHWGLRARDKRQNMNRWEGTRWQRLRPNEREQSEQTSSIVMVHLGFPIASVYEKVASDKKTMEEGNKARQERETEFTGRNTEEGEEGVDAATATATERMTDIPFADDTLDRLPKPRLLPIILSSDPVSGVPSFYNHLTPPPASHGPKSAGSRDNEPEVELTPAQSFLMLS
ncbi:hypothetical protein AAF712_011255 [Marasmius tenuissimus]|uniref:Uncharacterized protein n=1 Tax=Marasmius tenuissimus TaxID=585030 RepID=A0ABR2ZL08_9AGAR